MGATQIPFATCLVALLDQGHSLLDRILITFLKCLRPTPTQQRQRRIQGDCSYTLDQEATETVNTINEQFIAKVMKPSWKAQVRPRQKRLTSSSVLQQRSISLTTSLRSYFKAGSPHSQQTKLKSLHFAAPSNT